MKREKVSEDGCKECPYFKWEQHKGNMIKNNICHKRDSTGCYDDEVEVNENGSTTTSTSV